MQENKHIIRTRMLKNASRAWGYPETEAEANFDPLVSMLLAACSTELEKISGEIHASRARILERMVQLLSPDELTGPLTAHAIATACSAENNTMVTDETQLYITRKTSKGKEDEESVSKDFFFTPTASFNISKANIRLVATGNKLFSTGNNITKEVIAHATDENVLANSVLWIAVDEPQVSMHHCQFYFDCKNEAMKQLFYHQLPKAKWFFGDASLQVMPGYGDQDICGERLDINNILKKDYDYTVKIKKQINAFYKSSFVTLIDKHDTSIAKAEILHTPMSILKAFTAKEVQAQFTQPLRWISIHFPETVPNILLEEVVCVMNSFPVMNRRMHELNYRLQDIINIIPLQAEDLFLDLEDVIDDEGNALHIRSFQNAQDESFSMLMRNGGVGRFDERDAAAITDYTLQLLRDESAAFSIFGNDFMATEMKQLQQIINKLEQKLYTANVHRQQTPYLVVRNDKKRPWQTLFLHYWSCNGQEANNIKAGAQMQLYKGSSLEGNRALLVTTTVGGRNKLSTTDSVLAYKSALLSKNRLITNADIKSFCVYQLGEKVKRVDIEKGVMIHPDQQIGFVKTIDVLIEFDKKSFMEANERNEIFFWQDSLKLSLEEHSSTLLPYRVFIKQPA